MACQHTMRWFVSTLVLLALMSVVGVLIRGALSDDTTTPPATTSSSTTITVAPTLPNSPPTTRPRLVPYSAQNIEGEVMPSGTLEDESTSATEPVVTTTLPPAPTTSGPKPPVSSTSWPVTDDSNICDQVTGVSDRTFIWCPLVAFYLADWGALTLDSLTWNLDIIDCESFGDPTAKNPRSSALGLYQHITPYRDPRALKWLGRPVPDWTDPGDNIAVGVALFVNGGAIHWPNCGRR